ncbi:unnamed protein product, partial [Rotaria sp. Silwood1]
LDSFVRLSIEPLNLNITCLFDLSDKILLRFYCYMSPAYVLYSFYTPEMLNMRLHCLILLIIIQKINLIK